MGGSTKRKKAFVNNKSILKGMSGFKEDFFLNGSKKRIEENNTVTPNPIHTAFVRIKTIMKSERIMQMAENIFHVLADLRKARTRKNKLRKIKLE